MSKILIVSNRLPVNLTIDNNQVIAKPSVGGLATGMKSIYKSYDGSWIGWSGLMDEEITPEIAPKINKALSKEACLPVSLTERDLETYYYGFSNRTIWPLFHYFTEYTEYESDFWEGFKSVNQKFADVILKNIDGVDKIWIHDYQLMLLPKLIKDKCPDISIGFFLHIPFPSSEVFRILPWREELLQGMLGADLLGFHTYDYHRHFLSSVRRLLGHEINFNQVSVDHRVVLVDSFPMGIDYNKFNSIALEHQQKSIKDRSKVQQEIDKHHLDNPEIKFVLSIDRLDYTKGIANRLHAYEYFLNHNPEYREKVTLIMLAVPSRSNVEQYQIMKSEIDELVGRINGEFGTINWSPVWYFYRSMPFDNLIDLYVSSDVALITPIRDGMNLVAKEYIASRIDKKGVLILSEMAGAVQELGEALAINPNSFEDISKALIEAINMPEDEQQERMETMQKRLKRYDVNKWAKDFVDSLSKMHLYQDKYLTKKVNATIEKSIVSKYKKANKRIIFLDYDGTLVGFKNKPEDARPGKELIAILDKLASDPKNQLVLISGRFRDTFTEWFEGKNYHLIAEHGVWMREPGRDWEMIEHMNNDWKESIYPVLENFVDRTPGTFIEEKNYSLVWHYRRADAELSQIRANELKDELTSLVANNNLEIMEGNKVIEVKNAGINKGRAAMVKIGNINYDFILAAGDDWTDEYLFHELPSGAVSIKVGLVHTEANYMVESHKNIRKLLSKFSG